MAKNKKKKRKNYGNDIAPISNKFTINVPTKKDTKKATSKEEKKKILENNIKFEKDMINNNKFYDNKEQNMSYGPNHYKQALESDKKELNKLNKSIKKDKKETKNKTTKTEKNNTKEPVYFTKESGFGKSLYKEGALVSEEHTKGKDVYTYKNERITGKEKKKILNDKNINVEDRTYKSDIGNTWFKGGGFSDKKYNFGDVSKTILATGTDTISNVTKGFLNTAEGIADLATYGVSAGLKAVGATKKAKKVKEFAQKDLVSDLGLDRAGDVGNQLLGIYYQPKNFIKQVKDNGFKEVAKNGVDLAPVNEDIQKFKDEYSLIGQKTRGISQGIGQVASMIVTGNVAGGAGLGEKGITAVTTAQTGLSATGSAMNEAYQNGATDKEAITYGLISGVAEAGSELMFGGLGKSANAIGISKSAIPLDDAISNSMSKWCKTTAGKNLINTLVKASGEGVEEVVSGIAQAIGQKVTYMKEEDLSKLLEDQDLLDQFIQGAVVSGIAQTPSTINATKQGKSIITNRTANEDKLVEVETENRIKEEEKDGKKLTSKEKNAIREEVEEDLYKGYISTDTIEKTLGGDTYTELEKINQERQNIQTQIDELQQKSDNNELSSLEEKQKLKDLKEQIKTIDDTEIRNRLNQEIQETIKNDIGLQESYKEVGRRTENYNVDLDSIQDEKQKAVYQKAMDSGVLNNSNKTHALVDMIAKISSEKGINFDFTNNEQLEKSGFGVNGRNINGYVTDSGITINLNSSKAINRIVGHELTHTFEGTTLYTELQDSLKDFLGSEWDNQIAKYKDLYKGVKNANIENELTSDLIGDYLFTDENYVRNLSTKNKNLFQKIYDEIKYLYNVATAGSKEKRQLEKVKRTFDRIYNETESKVTSDTKLSITEDSNGNKLTKEQQNYFKNSKVVDNNGNLKVMYNGGGDYTTFDNTKMSDQSKWGKGIYLTEDSNIANMYGDNVKEVYVDIENPINQTEKTISFDKYNKLMQELYDEEADRYDYDMYDNDLDLLWDATNKGNWADYGEQLRDIVGVDGLIIEDSNPAERMAIAFNSNQIKNVSNEAPTSNPDIRFSITKDSKGKNLSEAQQEYFKDSKAVDDDGNLEIVYHGSKRAGFTTFNTKDNVSFYTNDEGVANTYSGSSEKVDTRKLESLFDAKTWLKGINEDLYIENNKVYDYDGEEILSFDNQEDLLKNLKRAIQIELGNTDAGGVYEGYVNITNPYTVDAKGKNWNDITIGENQKVRDMYESLTRYEKNSLSTLADKMDNMYSDYKEGLEGFYQRLNAENSDLYDKVTNDNSIREKLYRAALYEWNESNVDDLLGKRYSTNDIVNQVLEMNKNGSNYDGVIFTNIIDEGMFDGSNGNTSSVYVTFNPNQFKAVDNTNPTVDSDIRYSLSQDSQGRELSNEIIEKTQYSKIRDEEGKLEPFYHGSNKNIDVFDSTRKPFYNNQNVNFFTSSENIGKTYGSNVQEVYINSINPYIFDGDTDGYSLEYSNTAKEEYKNNKEIIDSIRNKLDENGGRYYKKSVAKNCDAILENKGNILSNEEINFLIEHPYTLASLSIKGKNGFVAYGNSVMTNDVVNAVLSINDKIDNKYDSVLFKSIKDSGQYYDENTLKEKSDVIATFDANQIVRDNDDIRYDLSIAPISKNFLTESEQNELDGLRALDNSGWTELTLEEQRRMQQLENKADVVLNKKAEKMLRSASYKAINTTTKVAENYLDFDAKQKKDFRNQMREFSNMTKDELINAETYNKVKDIVNQYANREYTYFDDSVEGIKKELKHTKIKISDELKDQITDYGYFVRDSKLMLRRNSGTPVDQVYKEYSDMYPNFFSNEVWNEADQLEELNNFINHDFSVTEKYRLSDDDLRVATDLIYNKLLQNSLSMQDLIETEEILDKKVQKRTRTVVREELLNKMGITPELIQVGKDISAIDFARTDPIRVNEKVFGWKTGQLINDATVNFTKHQEAERMRFLNKERQEIKDLGIKARSKESELVQKYGEKQYVDKNNEVHPYGDAELNRDVPNIETRNKIKNAARVLRQKYDTYIDRVNSVLTEMGYDEIPKRKDYMRHFVELDDKFSRWGLPFNKESMMAEDLPTDINGLTEFNRPGKSYFASANTRTGLQTTYDAITGIDGYLEGVSNLIYHTESIQRYRALTRFIRENYGREHGLDNIDLMTDEELAERIKDIQDNKLSKYVAWLDEQANSIAGKKGSLDRSVERMFGRRIYTALNTLKSQVGSNMTGFNVRSAMTNFASAIQGASKTKKLALVKGTISTINNIINNDGLIDKSDFLTRRLNASESLAAKPWQKLSKAGQIFMEGTDYFTANQIWRSKYFENLDKGMSETQAIKNADDFAARIMGDRSKGSTAELFNSKTLGFLSQFQLEVNNQWSSLIHDNKIDIQKGNKTALGVTFELGQLFAASYMFNTMMKSLTGSDVMIDPIDMLLKIFKPKDDDKDEGIIKRAQKVLGEFINQLPFANLITGGGRIPISEAFTGVKTLGTKLMGGTDNYGNEISWGDVGEDLKESLAYWVLPTGYGQIRKTVKGLSMYDDELPIAGSYTDSGNLRFSAEDTPFGKIKAGLFGQYSSKYAQDYIDSGYKSINASKLDEMKDLDMNSTEYRDYREGLSAAGTSIEDKLNYISDLDVSDEDKTIMASNVAKKDIDMAEYKKFGSYDEFNYAQKNPAKYEVMKLVGGYDTYKNYEKAISEITADYDRNGKAISNSRKNKVIKYVNSLNLTRAQKAMLIKEQYPSFTQYDSQIASYINNQNMSFIQKAGILKQLGFKAYDRQIINYIKQNYRTVEEQQEELEKLGFKIYNYNGKTYVR